MPAATGRPAPDSSASWTAAADAGVGRRIWQPADPTVNQIRRVGPKTPVPDAAQSELCRPISAARAVNLNSRIETGRVPRYGDMFADVPSASRRHSAVDLRFRVVARPRVSVAGPSTAESQVTLLDELNEL